MSNLACVLGTRIIERKNQTMNRSLLVLGVFAIVATCGCRAAQLQKDQDQMRDRLLELQTEQIMDNVIRARNSMPILHVDYKTTTGTVTQNADVGVDGSHSWPAISNTINWMVGGSHNQVLTVTGEPVYDQDLVYRAYLQFLHKPGRLVVSSECPPSGAAHIVRQRGDLYYWVPVEYAVDFLDLALSTTVMRGKPITPPTKTERLIVDVVVRPVEIPNMPTTAFKFIIQFDKAVRSSEGKMKVTINEQDKPKEFPLKEFSAGILGDELSEKDPVVGFGEYTDRLVVFQDFEGEPNPRATADNLVKSLKEKTVEIESFHFLPEVPATEVALLKSLETEMRLFRIQSQSVRPARR
jgi:hypothetical protein